jgi:hypothetical protein
MQLEAYMVMMDVWWSCGRREAGQLSEAGAIVPKRPECEKKHNAGRKDDSGSLGGCAGDGGSSGSVRVSR